MSEYMVYGLIGLVGVIVAALATWKVVLKSKSNKVVAKHGSIAIGRDYNAGDKNKSQN